MNLNDLLQKAGIEPRTCILLRHRPTEPNLRRILPWLAAERPELYNAFQQTQGAKLEAAIMRLEGNGWVASFIGHAPGKALLVGFYRIIGSHPLSYDEYWSLPAHQELKGLGMVGWTGQDRREAIQWIELELSQVYAEWQGKLIIHWPPPERSWWRRAHRCDCRVAAILEDGALVRAMPDWSDLLLSWEELRTLPAQWQAVLAQWRGIYYIFDTRRGKGYVGSACGTDNILGRWKGYAETGHGGNKRLRECDPTALRFSILQRLSPDAAPEDVIRIESSWKVRLHSGDPYGLNDN